MWPEPDPPWRTTHQFPVKGKVVKKLAVNVLPYKYFLPLCIFLSIITTAVSLLPPYMTKMQADDVLPAGNRQMLLVCVGILLGAYLN